MNLTFCDQLSYRDLDLGLQKVGDDGRVTYMDTPPAFNRAEITEQEYFYIFGIHPDGDPGDNYDPDFAGPDECEFEEYRN